MDAFEKITIYAFEEIVNALPIRKSISTINSDNFEKKKVVQYEFLHKSIYEFLVSMQIIKDIEYSRNRVIQDS